MGSIAVIGESGPLEGFALCGATVLVTADDAGAVAAWRGLDDDVALVVLSAAAARALGDRPGERPDVLTVVAT